jgi:hypothetical protein
VLPEEELGKVSESSGHSAVVEVTVFARRVLREVDEIF